MGPRGAANAPPPRRMAAPPQRPDTVKGSRAAAAALRSTTLGTINRFRAALADEQRANPKLPKNLDSVVLGYSDLLVSMRAAGSTDEPPPAPPT